MAGLNFTKANVKAMMAVLDQDHETLEDAARAALNAAYEIIQSRGKFTVVGQVRGSEPPEEREKVAFPWYATMGEATSAAVQLAGRSVYSWVLPVFHGTPHEWATKRSREWREELALLESGYREQELARRTKWFEEHPGQQPPEDWTVRVPFGNETDKCEACHGLGKVPKRGLSLT